MVKLPHRVRDIKGIGFGKLVPIKFLRVQKGAVWLCKCDCGNKKEVWLSTLTEGDVVSCGCHRRHLARINH